MKRKVNIIIGTVTLHGLLSLFFTVDTLSSGYMM